MCCANNLEFVEFLSRPHTWQHEQLGGVDGTGTQDYLTAGKYLPFLREAKDTLIDKHLPFPVR